MENLAMGLVKIELVLQADGISVDVKGSDAFIEFTKTINGDIEVYKEIIREIATVDMKKLTNKIEEDADKFFGTKDLGEEE